jgi:lipoprotein signal peptidase
MKIPFNPTHAPFVENRNFGNAFSYISSMKTTHLTLTALVCIATAAACTSPEKQPEKVVLQPPPTITVKDFFKNPEKGRLPH